MTHRLDKLLAERPAPEFVWWCQACRAAGHVHCAYVEECAGMDRILRAAAARQETPMTKAEARRTAYRVAYRFVQQAVDQGGSEMPEDAADQAKVENQLDIIAQRLFEKGWPEQPLIEDEAQLREATKLLDLECTCRVIEQCVRCEGIEDALRARADA